MPKPIKVGRKERMSFGTIEEVWPMPNLIDIQTKSYEQFLKEGLKEVFDDISPIRDYSDNLSLEFVDYSLSDPPKYGIEECRERKVTYAAPLNVKVRLVIRDTGEVKEQDIYMGDFPLMTEQGTFIINGSDRVIVTQLVRSPGAYYSVETDKSNQKLYSAQVIPTRGAWIEYETDSYGVLNVRVDRNRKQPVTILLRALGLETNEQIIDTLGTDERLLATLEKDPTANQVEALKEVYKKLRPGDPPTYDSAKALVNGLLFDAKRYDVAHVGRFKYNKKLGVSERLVNVYAEEDVIDPNTGEVLVERGGLITREMGRVIEQAGVGSVLVHSQDDETPTKIVGNQFVDIGPYLEGRNVDLSDFNVPADKVYYPVLKEILDMDLGDDELKDMLMSRRDELSPKHIIVPDIIAATSYLINLNHGVGSVDDIDHLGNRRLRTVGELLQNQFRIGLARMERSVRERMMQVQDNDATPQSLVNIRPVTAAVREFFGSSPLSQFIDQNNPLSELTNKRRLSALGPGGLSRERAGFEVRDIHYSHYGRLCPIETPEGPNIGLIGSLTTYGVINRYGFIETPYRIVDKEKGIVTKNVRYFAADEEELLIVAQANEPLDEEGHFVNEKVAARGVGGEIAMFPKDQVDLMDVSPKQVVSVASAMIPFLENDDANRALMGSNMQRQAVPLLVTEAPFVGTGIEYKAARDSGVVILAKHSGTVDFVDAENIIIVRDDGEGVDEYTLLKFRKSNQETCINQRPIVSHGEHIEEGEVIADGPSTDLGEISLGKNLLIGFMTWEGYNYEDAVILNEKLVMDDVLTSIHIVEYECKARETKLGPEEITSDIPGVSDSERRNLDENGIVRIGAEVNQRDILVGKVSPKGQSGHDECSEHLLRSVFGEKARDVKNTSRKMPNGEHGIVIDVQVYTRENSDELDPDVTKLVRVYVASKRKMQVGDKMAGRHGNKGVVSRILPEEDMPFLDDGTPLQMMLNPLGVPSRMNVGQVLEVHLGLVAKKKGWYVATPVFAGAKEENIRALLRECGYPESGKLRLRDGRTGEYFEKPITVGYMYMLKLHHLVDDKIHARSTATYSLITQQPLGGKAQRGGQRFGEMEVWALEAYGAAYTLQEILTVKSDDIVGRNNLYAAIVKGENIPTPGIPESFKVLIKELQSLALDVRVLNGQGEEIELKEVMGSGNYHYSLKPDAILERSPREPEMIELDEPKDAEAAAAAGSDEPDAEGSDFTGDVDEFDDGLADAGEASGPDADLEDSDLYDAEDLPDPEDAAEEPDTEE